MQSFKDAKERTWELSIDVGTVKRVKGVLGIDLYALIEDKGRPLGELLQDLPLLVNVIFVICSKQAAELGVSEDQFCEGFGGDVLEDAANAFVEALVDFFPNRKARETLRRVIGKGKDLGQILLERADERLNGIDLQAEADLLERKSREPSGASPASSASTQTA